MALLGSRKYTCIDKDALAGSADEICEQYIKNEVKIHRNEPDVDVSKLSTCKYYELPERLGGYVSHPSKHFLHLPKERNFEAWDIEDLKTFGENCNKCPYFGSKVLRDEASIVFLTYNYLLYPQIRKSSKIILQNNIVVFDEAHNIEDICREVGSDHLNLKHLTDVINNELSKSLQRDEIPKRKEAPLKDLRAVFSKLAVWLSNESNNGEGFTKVIDNTPNQESFKKDLSGIVAVKTFDDIGFGPDHLRGLWVAYYIIEDKSYHYTFDPVCALFKVDRNCMNAIRKFLSALHFLYEKEHDNFINLNDYQILLVKKRKRFALPYKNQCRNGDANQESSSHYHYGDSEIELHLICLSPAIAFKRIKEARTVIVTSGTLSPLDSFESELNTKFDYQLSAKHVLKPDRVFTAVISKYQIDSELLNFNYDFQTCERKFDQHQQDVVNIILDLCRLVKYGILVFVPSKSVMQKFQRTWNVNGNLEKIKKLKDVFIESDCAGNASELQTMIATYREKVEQSRGAILFAILRGRISEGIDFKDNQARCVITIGIPFLPWRDDKVTAKRAYNDNKCASRTQTGHSVSCLDGHQWYNAMAFRALNQAFGRCVRHSEDWGSIFIVDSRFVLQRKHTLQLSNWVREALVEPKRTTKGPLELVLPDFTLFLNHLQGSTDANVNVSLL